MVIFRGPSTKEMLSNQNQKQKLQNGPHPTNHHSRRHNLLLNTNLSSFQIFSQCTITSNGIRNWQGAEQKVAVYPSEEFECVGGEYWHVSGFKGFDYS